MRYLFILGGLLGYMLFSCAYAGPKNMPVKSTSLCAADVLQFDIDGDKSVDCIETILNSEDQHAELRIFLSQKSEWIPLLRFVPSDQRIEKIGLARYRNPKFPGPKRGWAIRIVFPEKSSVIFYWNADQGEMQEFWETD